MSYIAAKEVLPDHIVELIQKYVEGEYMSGTDKNILANKYFLTKKSIDRIILKEKLK